jgi:hypothetical protein
MASHAVVPQGHPTSKNIQGTESSGLIGSEKGTNIALV